MNDCELMSWTLDDDGTMDTVASWECLSCGARGRVRLAEASRDDRGGITGWQEILEACCASHDQMRASSLS